MSTEDLEQNIIQYTRFILFLDELKIDINENSEYFVYANMQNSEFVDKSIWPSWCRMWL